MTEGRNGIPPGDDTKIVSSYHRIIEPLAVIDGLLHKARIATWPLFWRLCDAYDLSLGTPDTPANFPRRWGRRGTEIPPPSKLPPPSAPVRLPPSSTGVGIEDLWDWIVKKLLRGATR